MQTLNSIQHNQILGYYDASVCLRTSRDCLERETARAWLTSQHGLDAARLALQNQGQDLERLTARPEGDALQ